jgi:hypothetical protein
VQAHQEGDVNTQKRVLGLVVAIGLAFMFGAQTQTALARTGTTVVKQSGAKSFCGGEWNGAGCSVCYDTGCNVVTCGDRKDRKCTIDHVDYPKAARKKPVSRPGAPGVTTKPAPVATSGGNTVPSRIGGASGHHR